MVEPRVIPTINAALHYAAITHPMAASLYHQRPSGHFSPAINILALITHLHFAHWLIVVSPPVFAYFGSLFLDTCGQDLHLRRR